MLKHCRPPWLAGATSAQAFKRLSALLLAAAETATATGTARPPPLLRRLQVQCWPASCAVPGKACMRWRLKSCVMEPTVANALFTLSA
jgi:hypothetical protein